MTFFSSRTQRILFILAMLCGAGRALAGPIALSTWHVAIDTTSLAGHSGYLDFLLLGLGDAQPLQASIDNFTGDYGGASIATGDAGGSTAGVVPLGNGAPWNEFAQWVHFGGIFTFDIGLAGEPGPGSGSNLGIALLDADFGYLGTPADVVTFALQPGVPVAVTAQDGIASVTAVPEPSTMPLVAGGLLLLAMRAARRSPRP
jgi:hypothetical protein